jgi:uncharacterized protein (TIGR02246 family)
MLKFLLWLILLVLCWPLALLALVLYPFVWLILLPFKVLGITVGGVLELVKGLIFLPGRLLSCDGPRPRPTRRCPMMRTFSVLTLFLTVSVFTAGQVAGEQAKAPGVPDEGVRKVLSDFVDAWNKHDARAFSMVFADDADFTNVRGVSAHGRTEVEKFHAPRFAAGFKDSSQKITGTSIRFIRSDVAAVDAHWEMTGAKGPDGQGIPLRKGLLTFVMTKEGDRWLIAVMHNMDLPAPP